MEVEIPNRKNTSRRSRKADVEGILRKSWYRLRLSVRHPARVPTWDAIILTAASPEQAQLYDWQLNRARRMGRISSSTVTLSVPDPDGCRIGSGSATLHAIAALARHYRQLEMVPGIEKPVADIPIEQMVDFMAKKHILLLHAGGDSKRVPWANPMGKVFLPLPYLAADDPDGPVPLLFDHILAISSCARPAFREEGGLFIMTGDVLPCFDASNMVLPKDASCIITVPITLDVASNHGVIVASKSGVLEKSYSLYLVENLLQKPSLQDLDNCKAILDDGRTLLDTGLIAAMSLYEDLVAAWVPARHKWLQSRPLGKELINDLSFLHFGTSSEVLDHLSGTHSGLVGRRHLCSIPATTVSDIAASAIIVSSKITAGVSIGEDSLVYDSSISGRVQIGSLSIVVGINIPEGSANNSCCFVLPDRHCLWEVPLIGRTSRVIVYCGLHDNPKNSVEKYGTFCGKPWKKVLSDLGIQESELWSSTTQDKCLWNAKIYPVLPYFTMLRLAMWLMGLVDGKNESLHPLWRSADRVSLEELHRAIDFQQMCQGSGSHQADLAAGIARACIDYGSLGRNLSQLCEEILQKEISGIDICKDFLSLCQNLEAGNSKMLPKSRAYQVQLDLQQACGDETQARDLEHKVWAAVADETASAVRYGFREHLMEPIPGTCATFEANNSRGFALKSVKVELPVRVDFVGGWSDTPPWSLERAGCVLNMAISLEGYLPVGTIIETTELHGIKIFDDVGNQLSIQDFTSISPPFDNADPFRLVKSALLVTDTINDKILQSMGLQIKTWANVPRGSGLGTSSILAAAVVKGLLQMIEGDDSNENVARLVLVLEQLMGTGGGWQDQIGGLYPGIKFTTSFPGIPLRLQVIPLLASPRLISELEQRLLVVFTGQVRLAHQVLHKVVTRYLQRDNLLISSIKRLAELAKVGREALMNCDIDELGEIMLEAWRLHQELDPYCSNEFVDRLFSYAESYCCGYKLVGAGGGGFALLLARDGECAKKLRDLLEKGMDFDVKVCNWNIFLKH
ncbi:GHMP kinase N-terminal domain [Dillenia turbinata]|uniref:GHMP kinase N-terminal domain n=1 Tax=Dillenia turbinata TaxID=194707 RepID=A0AAN8YYJ3_9MAGN